MSEQAVPIQTQADETTQKAVAQEAQVPCEVYSRIVGYLRPVQNWNKGKKQEFAARKTYRVREKVTE